MIPTQTGFFCFDRSCLRFICTDSTGGHGPRQTAAQGSHQSFHPHVGRQGPLLWSLLGGLGTFGGLSWSCSPTHSLGLGLSPWTRPAEPETLCLAGHGHVSQVWGKDIGKGAELAAAALWGLGLALLGHHEGLGGLGT